MKPQPTVTNKTVPSTGVDTGWLEEAGNQVHEIISVHGDRVFFTMRGTDGELRPATVQLWSRWTPPVPQFLVEIREPKLHEKVLHVAMVGNERKVEVLTVGWQSFPKTSLVIIHQGHGFKP